jgi:RNA polymerase subunit RPABC4/transcription elongation factor Spt4
MAEQLEACPQCGMQVSTEAKICPGCGHSRRAQTKLKQRMGCLVIAGVILAAFLAWVVSLSMTD